MWNKNIKIGEQDSNKRKLHWLDVSLSKMCMCAHHPTSYKFSFQSIRLLTINYNLNKIIFLIRRTFWTNKLTMIVYLNKIYFSKFSYLICIVWTCYFQKASISYLTTFFNMINVILSRLLFIHICFFSSEYIYTYLLWRNLLLEPLIETQLNG